MNNLHSKRLKLAPRIQDPRVYHSQVVESVARTFQVHSHPDVARLLGNLRSRHFASAVDVAGLIGETVYPDAESHFAMNQLAALVKKVPFGDPKLDPERSAWKKFLAAEWSCRRINQRIIAERRVGRFRYHDLRQRARDWIQKVIGVEPDFLKVFSGCGFGPGSSVGVSGQATHVAAKLCAESWSSTPTCLSYATAAMMSDHHIWEMLQERLPYCIDPEVFRLAMHRKVALCTANKVVMVPKTAKVHRTIAIEPLLNGYVQKGVDVYLRGRLKRFGLDLQDQTRNQRLAKLGSLGGFNPFVTLDLSAASDSLAIETVRDLLPPAWYSFLRDIRSPNYESALGSGRYEKFSSMGNGFCFPLETLVFASLAVACNAETTDTEFCVYGDDIIVRQQTALLLTEALKFYGFRINPDKSFFHGPFRESCGADYFDGINVRPYNLDFVPSTDRDIFKVYNGLRENPYFCPLLALEVVAAPIPSRERLLRPYPGPPDGAMTVPMDVFMGSTSAKWCHGIQTWTWREYVDSAVADYRRPPPSVQMYGLLRGSMSSHELCGSPQFSFRKRVTTRIRDFPSRPLSRPALAKFLKEAFGPGYRLPE